MALHMTPAQIKGCTYADLQQVLKCPQAGFPLGTKPSDEHAWSRSPEIIRNTHKEQAIIGAARAREQAII
jgi:hypothetical protein